LDAARRILWRAQVPMAAVLTLRLNRRLNTILGKAPTLGQIYFAHILDEDAAADLLAGDRGRSFQVAYSESRGAAAFAALVVAEPSIATTGGGPATIQDVLNEAANRLDIGYRDAAPVIDSQPADVRFFHAENGDPPWLMVAREESFRGVFEFPGADNNARISQYLRVTGLTETSDEVPWCGAFVAYCMKSCGDAAAAASVRPGAARAADWLNWGQEAPVDARPAGTLVVLKPQVPNSSGHVGFLVEAATGEGAPDGKIRLLGGNQGDPQRVCTVDFDASQVADMGYRRPGAEVQPATKPVVAANTVFGSLVPGGFFSADPTDMKIARSIRTNNPGALNFTSWQAERPGFVGKSQPDGSPNRNVTTIYRTPEHGVASWFHLLNVIYRFGAQGTFALRSLAQRYAGSAADTTVEKFVAAWVSLSAGTLTETSVIDITKDQSMLQLGKAMFRLEAGQATPVQDDQILFAIEHERAGTLQN
jgi:uncharacterized protein (TIGR02594 family)